MSRKDYAEPTREIAEETGCKFIDENKIVTDAWNSMSKNRVLSGYFVCEPLESKAYPTHLANSSNTNHHLLRQGTRRHDMRDRLYQTNPLPSSKIIK